MQQSPIPIVFIPTLLKHGLWCQSWSVISLDSFAFSAGLAWLSHAWLTLQYLDTPRDQENVWSASGGEGGRPLCFFEQIQGKLYIIIYIIYSILYILYIDGECEHWAVLSIEVLHDFFQNWVGTGTEYLSLTPGQRVLDSVFQVLPVIFCGY